MRINSRNLMVVSLFLFWIFWSHFLPAQEAAPAPIDAKTQQAIIADISKLLIDNYVYLEPAQKMSNGIQERLKSGAYSKLTNPDEFAEAVYNDLEAISKDKHLGFRFAPERAAEILKNKSKNEAETKQAREAELAEEKYQNFGFQTVQHLQGNVGYLNLLQFADAADGGEAAIAALTFLSHCDAVIIDLRQNGGGDPTQIQLISSYFFAEPTHLNDLYYRNEDKTENYWTFRYVPGTRLDKADLYILTSQYTFSGAEEFSYNLKNLKRATLIGETTGGGAHPTDPFIVQTKYILRVPTGRAINPISKTNWEGTGVAPDVAVPQKDAFDKAYEMALEKLAGKVTTEDAKAEVQWALDGVKVRTHPVHLDDATLQKYAGAYGERKVTYENGALYYQRTGPKYHLLPMSETMFALEGEDGFRLEFGVENGKAVKVIGHYVGGNQDETKRSN